MTTLTQLAQLELELINRARMDPAAEAARAGISLNEFLNPNDAGVPITTDPKQVLAGNNQLTAAAVGHTAHMIAVGNVQHDGIGDADPGTRIANAGYVGNTVLRAENIGAGNASFNNFDASLLPSERAMAQKFVEDNHRGLFKDDPNDPNIHTEPGHPGGHRLAMLDPSYKEAGIGATTTFSHTQAGNLFGIAGDFTITQNFGNHGTDSFLTGAVYNDTVIPDHFYSLEEAVAGVKVTARNAAGTVIGSDTTGAGGGWSVAEPGGTFKLTFSAAGKADVSATIEADSHNAKIDLVNGNEIYANGNTTLGDGAVGLRLIGIEDINGTGNSAANTIVGNSAANVLEGKGGDDNIDGGAGSDTAVFSGVQANYRVQLLDATSARITDLRAGANDGADVITNIELVKFADKTVSFGSLQNTPTPPANRAPVVSVTDSHVDTHGSASLSSMFKATDQDGNATISRYAFMDGGTASGKILIDGVAQAAGKWVFVNAADLASVKYVAGATVDSETISIKAFDGVAWSAVKDLTIDTTARAVEDFGGNGKSDILFHNAKGSVTMWQMNGSEITLDKVIGSMATSWSVVGEGDFGGDGKADILWQNTNGSVTLWQMNGSKVVSSTDIGSKGTNWHVAAVEDFNADGKADILWRSDAGSVSLWQMDGAKVVAKESVSNKIEAHWLIEDAADFSGNGKADVLLRNDNGDVKMWLMDGNDVTLSKTFGTIGNEWHYVGAGDFNNDGRDDILWHSDSGKVRIWEMDGTKIVSDKTVGSNTTAWDVADVGDYNNDGHADILWQKNDGTVMVWEMDGNTVLSKQTVASIGTDWHVV